MGSRRRLKKARRAVSRQRKSPPDATVSVDKTRFYGVKTASTINLLSLRTSSSRLLPRFCSLGRTRRSTEPFQTSPHTSTVATRAARAPRRHWTRRSGRLAIGCLARPISGAPSGGWLVHAQTPPGLQRPHVRLVWLKEENNSARAE